MKRTLALLSVAALVATPAVAEAAKKKPAPKPTKRTVDWSYTGFHGATTPAAYTALENPCTVNAAACFTLTTESYETLVDFKEASGAKVAIQYFLDDDYDTVATVCTGGSIPVAKGQQVSFVTVLDATCAGVPTQGKVSITVTGKK